MSLSMLSRLLSSLVLAVLFLQDVAAFDTKPIIPLDYITLQGAYSSTYNITHFRKIPFGASTAPPNRFRAPQPPTPITNGTYNTDQSFDMCPQRTVNGSEDCLYLGLYSRPWNTNSTATTKRPVLVVFYGGGFIQGSASFTIPPAGYPVLNVSSANNFIVVYPNYRTNAMGFLASRAVKDSPTADLNAGLLDQQAALQWVNKYISHFGGDPNNVTIWGQSAGGGSVVAQTIANGGNTTPKLFSKALASSPFWEKTYRYDDPEPEADYKRFAQLAGCGNAADSLACLKTADLQRLRDASLVLTGSHTYNTSSYTWAPVVDGEFIQEPLSEATSKGKLNAEMVFGTYNLHEGTNFIPPGLANRTGAGGFNSSIASFDAWLKGFLPGLSEEQLEQARKLYPINGTAEEITYNTTYERAGLVYRDVVLACPALWMAQAAKGSGWIGEYTISPAKHGSDTIYWNQVNAVQKSQPLIYQGYAGALASFVQAGDPNAHKVTSASVVGVPPVSMNKEYVIEQSGLNQVGIEQLEQRCAFWRAQAGDIPV